MLTASENGSNLPTVFTYGENNKVSTIQIENQSWFQGSDICNILGIKGSRDLIRRRLDDDEKMRLKIASGQNAWFVNESGLYNLIFRSNKPEAKLFRKWVTNEVLPKIRQVGFYDGIRVKTFSNKNWITSDDYCKNCETSMNSFFGLKAHYSCEFLFVDGRWFLSSDLYEAVVMLNRAKNRKKFYRVKSEMQLSLFGRAENE